MSSSRRQRNRLSLCRASQDSDSDKAVNQVSEPAEYPAPRRIAVPPHLRPPSEGRFYSRSDIPAISTSTSSSNNQRRSSVGGFPFRSSSRATISRLFGAGNKTTPPQRSASRASMSSTMTLFRSAFGGNKKAPQQEEDEFLDDTYFADGSCKPILSFKGGAAWKYIDREREELALDLFWPTKKAISYENPFRPDILPLDELRPLTLFCNLRVLKLSGMLQSYQKHIWLAVWNNPHLEELELEMALEPCIRRPFSSRWPSIKGDWIPRTAERPHDSYYGANGSGELSRRVGFGEYLDKLAIAEAKEKSVMNGMAPERLTIVQLSLTGFVVDSDPFFLWFNPLRLRVINFKNDCVDAGFALPSGMSEHVVVSWPRRVAEQATWARRVKPGEVKIIDIGPRRRGDGGQPSRGISRGQGGAHVGCSCHHHGEGSAAGHHGHDNTNTAPTIPRRHRGRLSMRPRGHTSMLMTGGRSVEPAEDEGEEEEEEETSTADSEKSKKKKSPQPREGNQEANSSTAEPRRFLQLPNGRRAFSRKSK